MYGNRKRRTSPLVPPLHGESFPMRVACAWPLRENI